MNNPHCMTALAHHSPLGPQTALLRSMPNLAWMLFWKLWVTFLARFSNKRRCVSTMEPCSAASLERILVRRGVSAQSSFRNPTREPRLEAKSKISVDNCELVRAGKNELPTALHSTQYTGILGLGKCREWLCGLGGCWSREEPGGQGCVCVAGGRWVGWTPTRRRLFQRLARISRLARPRQGTSLDTNVSSKRAAHNNNNSLSLSTWSMRCMYVHGTARPANPTNPAQPNPT